MSESLNPSLSRTDPACRPLSDEALQLAIDRAAAIANDMGHVLSVYAAGQYQALCDVQLYRAQLQYLPDAEPEDEVTR